MLSADGCAEGLRSVLEDRHGVRELIQRRRTPVEVDCENRLRPLRHPLGDVARIDVQRRRVDVCEDRRCAAPGDGLGGRVEGEGGADDFIPWADPEGVQDEHEGVGPVGHADRVRGAEVGRNFLLEGAHVRTEDELPGLEHLLHPLPNLVQKRPVLGLDVGEGDGHGG